ncbi:MAG: peptide chain release factor N(5)-glutamine methyltransferase [Rhizobiaceae bacterium]|nr:peptide chain release factor N(5)-glutamine methyltransferase [Rhizobiaceae bacterium]
MRAKLRDGDIDGADLDARLLVADALGLDFAALMLRSSEPVSDADQAHIAGRIARRLAGEPVHRILGRRAFYAHDFALSPETLEPRSDTEALVELSRGAVEEVLARQGTCLIADVGTGTGAIAVSLLALYPAVTAVAVDLAPGALVTARSNASSAGVGERFWPVASDYLSAFRGPFDLIVSNPPYIPSADVAKLSREVRGFDPRLVLDGGTDGLDAYRTLARQCAELLGTEGHALFEIGQGQASSVRQIFLERGLVIAASKNDLNAVERALHFRRDA